MSLLVTLVCAWLCIQAIEGSASILVTLLDGKLEDAIYQVVALGFILLITLIIWQLH